MPDTLHSVTHVASGDLWAGAEALVFSLAREQHKRQPGRVRCVLMNSGRLARELHAAGIPTLVLDESLHHVPALSRSLRSHLRSIGPTVVHAHREKENVVAWLATLGSGVRTRLVTTVHGQPEPMTAGNGLRRTAAEFANSVILRLGFDAIVGVSRDVETTLRRRFGRTIVHCIRNGIEVPVVRESGAMRVTEGSVRLLALGRLVPIKRYDRLLALSNALATMSIGRPMVILGGDGPLAPTLRQQLLSGMPAGHVSMPGHIEAAREALREADALVITSDHEGIPMVALEALSIGVPVFAFAVGGIPEISGDGVPLFLSPPGDVAAMAASIEGYFAAHPRGQRVGPPRNWAFDIRCCADAYDRLYASLG